MEGGLATPLSQAPSAAPGAWAKRARHPRGLVDVLEIDHDLASAASASPEAMPALPAVAIELPVGPWAAPTDARPDVLGLLVLDGLLIRRTVWGEARCDELIGPGDFLRPWLAERDGLITPRAEWEVGEPTRLALLNGNAGRLCAACPAVLAELLDRVLVRSRRQGLQNAIATRGNRIGDRVLLLFGHLAERWGTVGGDGVAIALPLKHASIAALVGARRPTVSSALSELREARLLLRRPDGWLLTHQGRDRLVCLSGK